MRVLVTGGAGFIGSHLCDFLLAHGCEVVCMDNLLTGSTDNIAHISDPRFLFVKHDVTNYIVVGGPLDYVLHFASPASPIDYLELPIQTLKVGALGTHKALGLAKEKRARFLLAGREYIAMDSGGAHPFTFTPAISLFVDCEDEGQLDAAFAKLSDGGSVLMALQAYPFSPRFGWVADRFGVAWMVAVMA